MRVKEGVAMLASDGKKEDSLVERVEEGMVMSTRRCYGGGVGGWIQRSKGALQRE